MVAARRPDQHHRVDGRAGGRGPGAVRSLDHVSATPQTLARRALWLDGNYDLTGARVLCVGDHDLTSLALGLANPAVQVTVVDIDERILELIDTEAGRLGLNVRCLFADLRFGVPPVAAGWADMAITDPPYTPEGVQLFATRGLQGLHGRDAGRLVVAYGFGESQPALGHKVQRAMLDLYLTFEAVDPGFNRYRGAQAVGSASELYVCRPTPRTWRALPKLAATAAANIYTRGSQAREAVPTGTASEVFDEVVAAAAGPRELPVGLTIGRSSTLSATVSVGIDQLLTEGMPSSVARGNPHAAVADLSAGQSGWLLRVLLVTNADRLALLVPNNHPDLASEAAQRQLITLVWDKYALRFRRSSPSPRHAIVEAERIDAAGLGPTAWLARWILDRAHGTVGSVWRDGLVRLSRDLATETLTKNQARTLVRDAAPNPDMLTGRLVDLPRHQVAGLLTSMTTAAGGLEAG